MAKFNVQVSFEVEALNAQQAFTLVRQDYAIAHDPKHTIASIDFEIDDTCEIRTDSVIEGKLDQSDLWIEPQAPEDPMFD